MVRKQMSNHHALRQIPLLGGGAGAEDCVGVPSLEEEEEEERERRQEEEPLELQ